MTTYDKIKKLSTAIAELTPAELSVAVRDREVLGLTISAVQLQAITLDDINNLLDIDETLDFFCEEYFSGEAIKLLKFIIKDHKVSSEELEEVIAEIKDEKI